MSSLTTLAYLVSTILPTMMRRSLIDMSWGINVVNWLSLRKISFSLQDCWHNWLVLILLEWRMLIQSPIFALAACRVSVPIIQFTHQPGAYSLAVWWLSDVVSIRPLWNPKIRFYNNSSRGQYCSGCAAACVFWFRGWIWGDDIIAASSTCYLFILLEDCQIFIEV